MLLVKNVFLIMDDETETFLPMDYELMDMFTWKRIDKIEKNS